VIDIQEHVDLDAGTRRSTFLAGHGIVKRCRARAATFRVHFPDVQNRSAERQRKITSACGERASPFRNAAAAEKIIYPICQ